MEEHMPALAISNERRITLPGPRLLHDIISTAHGDSCAIDFLLADDSRVALTYDQFESASLRLSHQIHQLLLGLGSRKHIIPLILPQCPELYLAWRAVLQTGACVCPVQHDVPPERLKFIVKDVYADIILCLEDQIDELQATVPSATFIPVSLWDYHAEYSQQPHANPSYEALAVKATDPAYIMYTSGSTGVPKGVVISHFAVTQSLLAHEQVIPPFRRFLQFASPTFDVSIFEIFFPFLRAQTLVGCTRERMLADLPGTMVSLDVDATELTPTVASTLLRTRNAVPCLRLLLTIGEMLTTQVIEQFGGSQVQKSILFAMYGPTEAAIHCTLATNVPASSSVRNIGKPLPTVTAFILKKSTEFSLPEIALVNEIGELAIAGQLADGYLNRSDQTEAAFIAIPTYGTIYCTGDRARCLPDGSLEIMGRMDNDQVKLRGQRVELGEIEEVASKTTGVTLAVAIIQDDRIIVFYESPDHIPETDIQTACKAWLPSFMRPGQVICLPGGFPRLSSGKVDRKTLSNNYTENLTRPAPPLDSGTSDTERVLMAEFENEFNRPVARNSDIWSCGLDSLKAIKIANRLRNDFPDITMHAILRCESIVELAAQMEEQKSPLLEQDEPRAIGIDIQDWGKIHNTMKERFSGLADSISKILPCNSVQVRMLAETSRQPDLNFSHISLKTALNISELDIWNAICRLAESNELLRSGFVSTASSSMPFVQVVWSELSRQDLSLLHPLQLRAQKCDGKEQFVVHLHHCLFDGWSWELMLDDLNAILAGRGPSIRPSFETFVAWQCQQESNASVRQAHHQYWQQLLDGHVPSLLPNLTTFKTEPTITEPPVLFILSMPSKRLSELSASLHVSRPCFLMACWAIIMSKYTESSDVITPYIASGRHVPVEGVGQVLGPCMSSLTCRVRVSSLKTAKDLLFCIQRQYIENFDHLGNTLSTLLKSYYGNDSLFVWQEGEQRSPVERNLVSTNRAADTLSGGAVLEIEPVAESLKAKLTVDTERFPQAHAYIMLRQLDHLLTRIVSNLDMNLTDVWDMAPEADMSLSNPKYCLTAGDETLMETIRRCSEQNPTRPALRFIQDFDPSTGQADIRVLSYEELHRQACTIGANLSNDYLVQNNDLVAIIAEKSPELYQSILGIIMSGAGYLAIEPGTPPKRVNSILQQARCNVLLIVEGCHSKDSYTVSTVVNVADILKPPSLRGPRSILPSSPHDLAYAVGTSGTTGVPKGIFITRHSLMSNVHHLSKVYPCEPSTDSLLQACSSAFDVSVFEIFWTWHMGMTLVAAKNDVLFRDIEALIDHLGVTHLSLTPSVAALVRSENVPKVKILVTAGEPMNAKVFRSWAGRCLYQGYGPSETTNICTVRAKATPDVHQNNVGSALANTSLFICARTTNSERPSAGGPLVLSIDDFKLLPKGAVGEVWIGGEQVARGYTDEMLTAESFLDHPSYGRLYRSGDLGRLLSDNTLVILGRIDYQTKIRGRRIELGEINSVLLQNMNVEDAFSLVDAEASGSDIVSFCAVSESTRSKNSRVLVKELFSMLWDCLPSYMIPDFILPVAEIPLTKQGKVDRRDLLKVFKAQSAEDIAVYSWQLEQESAPRQLDERELEVANVLSKVTAVDLSEISASASFYKLGLDSISAIQFSQLLARRRFGQVDVSTILKHPSIQSLTPLLRDKEQNQNERTRAVQMAPDIFSQSHWLRDISTSLQQHGFEVQKALPCTDLQLSLLSKSEDSDAYQNTLRFAVKGDIHQLKRAWTEVLRRHDLLRCIFVRSADSAMPYAQLVLRDRDLTWDVEGLRPLHPNLDDVLPFQPFWITTSMSTDNDFELTLHIHHTLYDAEGMSCLLKEVELAFNKQPLPPACQFDLYVDYMMNLDSSKLNVFWERSLKGILPSRLADLIPIEHTVTGKHPTRQVSITCRTSLSDLESSASDREVSVLCILQSAIVRLMFHAFNRQDVCFGNVFSGRNLPIDGIDSVIGPCFNTLPVRVAANRTTSNHQLAATLHDANLEILPWQPSPPRQIQRAHSPDGSALFDVLLLLQQSQADLDSKIWELIEDRGHMSFPFILEINRNETRDELTATLHSEVADEDAMNSILSRFEDLLKHCVNYPDALAMDFSSMLVHSGLRFRQPDVYKSQLTEDAQGRGEDLGDVWWSKEEVIVRDTMIRLSTLTVPKVSKDTSLFNLGLDSISAVQLAVQLRKVGYSVSSTDLLEAPKIFEIALKCGHRPGNFSAERHGFDFAAFDALCRQGLCKSESVDSSRIDCVRPCTALQQGILTKYLESGGSLYLNTLSLELAADVDLPCLRRGWEIVMRRHDMLRTGFAECNTTGHPFMMVTYRPDHMQLPWSEGPSERECEYITLLKPPWRLILSQEHGVRFLAITMLHALYDAQSLDMILGEVASYCLNQALTKPINITPTISSILARAESEDAKSFWQERQNSMQPTKFPSLIIHNTSAHRTSSVATRTLSIALSNVQEHAARLDCSLQPIFQVAWAKLLAAYTGQQRVTFGLVLSGRNYEDSRSASVFPCINVVPCSVEVESSLSGNLAQVARLSPWLSRFQYTPLPTIKRWQTKEAESFDTVLVLQKFATNQPKHELWTIAEDKASAEYAISLEVLPEGEHNEIVLRATYTESVLPAEACNRMLDQLNLLITEIVGGGDSLEASEALNIRPPQQQRLPSTFRFLHEMVERTADLSPTAPAIEFVNGFVGDQPIMDLWSYAELNSEGNRVAHLLIETGAETGDMIAVCFDKCPQASFAILGILKAGCAYVAIDPAAPVERKRFISRDSRSKVVLTTADKTLDFHSDGNVMVVALDEPHVLSKLSPERVTLSSSLDPLDTCYCLYTSGSTGTPKGCLISHESAVQAMLSFEQIFKGHWSPDSRWLQFASFHFDVSILEQFFSWYVGFRLTSAPRDLLLDDLSGFIQKLKITHLDLTPSLARMLTPEDVPSLCDGVFIVGGEAVSQDIIETWGDAGCLYNFYGPSEVTIGCTVRARVTKGTKSSNIGQQWENVGTFVLTPGTQEPVMCGAIGELCLSGPLVGKGYLNRPDLTAKSFIRLEKYDTRVYRTGDLVRLLHDDSFEFLGRIDDQVKLRGQRLEIGEINQVIRNASSIFRDIATIVMPHPTQGKEQLVAFFSISTCSRQGGPCQLEITQEAEAMSAKLRRHCMNMLPAYMIPSSFFQLNIMPLTVNNKIDNKKLAQLYKESSLEVNDSQNTGMDGYGPQSEAFAEVTSVLAEWFRLSTHHISPDSSLFEMGLDSVSAIGLSRKLRGDGFVHSTPATVMKNANVSDLVEALTTSQDDFVDTEKVVEQSRNKISAFGSKHRQSIAEVLHLYPRDIEFISPCTPLQQGMISRLTLSREAHDLTYFAQFHYSLKHSVDPEKLKVAWKMVQNSTSILRTYFVPTTDGFAQVVLKKALEDAGVDQENVSWTQKAFPDWVKSARSFGSAIPWRLMAPHNWGHTYFTLFIFHGLYDGVSLQLLLDKVANVYQNVELNTKESQFYTILPYGPLRDEVGTKEFWRSHLPFTRRLDLDEKYRPRASSEPMRRPTRHTLPPCCLEKVCSSLGITYPALFQAAWLQCLEQVYSVNPSIGIVVSGRSLEHEDAESVIGPMFNTIPYAIDGLPDNAGFGDLVKACHRFNINALPYQHTALRDIARWTGQDLQKGLFDSLFVFQGESKQDHDLWKASPADAMPDYALNFEVEQRIDGSFSLTIVSRQEFLDLSDEQNLLSKVADMLKMFARGDGVEVSNAFKTRSGSLQQVIRENTARAPAAECEEDIDTNNPSMVMVREHISELSGVDASKVRLTRPSLFELGLDSIDAMKLAARLRSSGMRVPISRIMQAPTVGGIVKYLEYFEAQKPEEQLVDSKEVPESIDAQQSHFRALLSVQGVELQDVERILPITPMQEGLLVDFENYYNVMAFRLEDHVDVQRLKQVWVRVIENHPMLRTKFVAVEDTRSSHTFFQLVSTHNPFHSDCLFRRAHQWFCR